VAQITTAAPDTTFLYAVSGAAIFAPYRELYALLPQSEGGFAAELVVAAPQLTP